LYLGMSLYFGMSWISKWTQDISFMHWYCGASLLVKCSYNAGHLESMCLEVNKV